MEKEIKEKRCPKCGRIYVDETLNYCLADGSFLYFPEEIAAKSSDIETQFLDNPAETVESPLKPADAATEVLEIPTEVRNSIPTLVVPKNKPSFTPEIPVASMPEPDKASRTFVLIGSFVISLLIISALIYVARSMLGNPSTISSNKTLTAANNASTALPAVNANSVSTYSTPSPEASVKTTPRPVIQDDSRLLGTNWKTTDGQYERHTMRFLSGGKLDYKGKDIDFMEDTWTTDGDTVIISLNNEYVRCEGAYNDKLIVFDCQNINNLKWKQAAAKIK